MKQRGVTLIELLLTIIIGSIAMLALAVPFSAERLFWNQGKRETESQRDAQLAMQAIARVARDSNQYLIPNSSTLVLTTSCQKYLGSNPNPVFARIVIPKVGTQLEFENFCTAPIGSVTGVKDLLIDGNRSQVEGFTATQITNKSVHVALSISHLLRPGDPRKGNEFLDTELFLRNGPP